MRSEGEALLAALRAGDEPAFRVLFRQHSPAMYAVALRLLACNVADAEDAVQEAWLRACRGASSFRGDSTLRTWLVGIAVRCALEQGRRRQTVPLTAAPEAGTETAPSVRLDIERLIATLADGYRHVLVLHDIHGYTHKEIGELLDIDEGTSKSQLSRARQLLRRALGEPATAEESAS